MTVVVSVPGNPWSPSGLTSSSSRPATSSSPIDVAVQTRSSNPSGPPCRVFGPLLSGSSYVVAVQLEGAAGDAVAVAADERAEVGVVVRDVAGQVVEAEDDVLDVPVLVGDLERLDDAAVGEDAHRHVAVGQGPALDVGAVGRGAEGLDGRARIAVGGVCHGGVRGAADEQAGTDSGHKGPAAPSRPQHHRGTREGRRRGGGTVGRLGVRAWGLRCPWRSTGVIARWQGHTADPNQGRRTGSCPQVQS